MTYSADVFIDAKTLDWATQKGCPEIFTDYVSGILVKALGIDGTANVFAKVFPADIICLGYCKMERNIFVHFQKKNYSVL